MSKNSRRLPRPGARAQQRGVVLFVALIAMVVLSLAGVALIRAVDTNVSVAGNLAFRQASIAPINHAVETAAEALFYARTIANPFNDDFGNNYYASLQVGEITDSGGHLTGVPTALYGNPPAAYPPGFQKRGPDSAGNTVRWVIERICKNGYAGDPISVVGVDNCDLMVPKLTPGRKTNTAGGIAVPPIPIYRVTVRVDGPANTVSFAQAMLR